jgi:cell fate (sporulation/competence/biofilm development) regulator YlbF (YheA/YmcA/DUF963 family)
MYFYIFLSFSEENYFGRISQTIHKLSQKITKDHKTPQNITKHHNHRKLSQNITNYCKLSQNITNYRKLSQNITNCRKLSQNITKYHQTSQNITTYRKTSQTIANYHKTSQNITKHQKYHKYKVENNPTPAMCRHRTRLDVQLLSLWSNSKFSLSEAGTAAPLRLQAPMPKEQNRWEVGQRQHLSNLMQSHSNTFQNAEVC